MEIQIIAEYNCTHPSRVIHSGEWRDIQKAMEESKGDVVFSCQKCQRGAAFVVIKMNGKEISRVPASDFLGRSGVKLSRAPDPENN